MHFVSADDRFRGGAAASSARVTGDSRHDRSRLGQHVTRSTDDDSSPQLRAHFHGRRIDVKDRSVKARQLQSLVNREHDEHQPDEREDEADECGAIPLRDLARQKVHKRRGNGATQQSEDPSAKGGSSAHIRNLDWGQTFDLRFSTTGRRVKDRALHVVENRRSKV